MATKRWRTWAALAVIGGATVGGALYYKRVLADREEEKAAAMRRPLVVGAAGGKRAGVRNRPTERLWPDDPATRAAARPAGAVLAPSGIPASKVLASLDDPDPAVRRRMWLQLNNLGGDALPLVEKVRAAGGAPGPEASMTLEQAAKVIRARARREARDAERVAWERAQVRRAYEANGNRDARWDAEAKRAIDGWLEVFVRPGAAVRLRTGSAAARGVAVVPASPELQAVVDAFKAAEAKGCNDPLVLSLHFLAIGEEYRRGVGPVGRTFRDVVRELSEDSECPAAVRLFVGLRYGLMLGRMVDWSASEQLPDWFKAMAEDPKTSASALDATAEAAVRFLGGEGTARGPGVERVIAAYERAAPGRVGPMVLRGDRLIKEAWEARGSGWASTVTPEGWKGFYEKLDAAEAVLTKAHELDPTDARAATLMLTVKMGQGERGGGRDSMETWFARATEADPDNLEACSRKLYYLQPKWYGSYPELIAFGRECLATRNWRGGVAMFVLDAHESVAEATGDTKAYFEIPEVWADVNAVYEGAVVNFPDDYRRRSHYVVAAARAGHWDVAAAQLAALGDHADLDVFGGRAMYDYYVRKAARLGGGPAQPPVRPQE